MTRITVTYDQWARFIEFVETNLVEEFRGEPGLTIKEWLLRRGGQATFDSKAPGIVLTFADNRQAVDFVLHYL